MNKFINGIQKNLHQILTGLAVGGTITTTVLAIRATPMALELLDDHVYDRFKNERDDEDYWYWLKTETGCSNIGVADRISLLNAKTIISTTWQCYIPTLISGGVTIACIIGANTINNRRYAALAGLYAISDVAFREYKEKVVQELGESKDRKVRDAIAKDTIENNPVIDSNVIIAGDGDVLCYEALSGRYFKSDLQSIRKIENDLNEELLRGETISLSDVFFSLGLPTTTMGDMLGWVTDFGLIEFDFSSQLTSDGRPCIVIGHKNTPTAMI